MSQESPTPPPKGHRSHLSPRQTLIFVGDHTSPDDPGYVAIARDVLARFHPDLRLNLIPAGSRGQKAGALRSTQFIEILTSSRPDWLVIGIGLADALSEPVAASLLARDRESQSREQTSLDQTFGHVHLPGTPEDEPVSDSGPRIEPRLENISAFEENLASALEHLNAAGVHSALLTLTTPGPDRYFAINGVLHAYSRAIRRVAESQDALLVDVDLAFRNLFDRAANYKQRVALSGPSGALNAQGQTLIARTFLDAFGLLPYPGYRTQR